MAKQSNKTRLLVGLVVLAVLLGVLFVNSGSPPTESASTADEDATVVVDSGEGAADPLSSRRESRRPGIQDATKDSEAVAYLQDEFGATITNKRTQIKALEKLINYLMKAYPDDWETRLQALLGQAFPGMADEMFGRYQSMTAYNEWLKANHGALAEMTQAESRDATWEARERFFGDDVAEIWEESLRHERIYDAMDSINNSPDLPLQDKLSSYMGAIREGYGDSAPDFIENRQTELTTKFLALPSVQDDLRALDPAQRQQQLSDIRKGMGMEEEAIDRWRDLDAQRDQAWEAGQRYMEERARIEAAVQGAEQARRIAELRTQTFGPDAATIGDEEAGGFFRFGHDRVYGKE